MVGIPADIEIAVAERRVARGWDGRGERIVPALVRTVHKHLCERLRAQRIAEAPRIDDVRLQEKLRTERSGIYHAVVDHARHARVVENACCAAETGLAVAEHVPGKAHARSEIVHAVAQAIVGKALIAGEKEPSRCIGKYRGMHAGGEIREAELRPAILDFAPRQPRFPAQTQIDGESAMQSKVVLHIQSCKNVPIVLELSRALPKSGIPAVVTQLARQQTADPVETEFCRLEELVADVHAAALQNASEAKVMLATYPAHIVAPGKVVAHECGG